MLDDIIYYFTPRVFCALTFLVNPFFVYLIFTEKAAKFGNYRFILLFFATYNLTFSVFNIVFPMDIHTYRYCFYLMIKDGWFVESTELNFHLLVARCSIVFASNAILLTHFVYRYLVIHESNFTKKYFGWYIAASFLIFGLFFGVWYAICYHLARVNIEIRQYIREDFRETYGTDSKNYNMIGVLFQEGSEETTFRSWIVIILWTSLSVASLISFIILATLIMCKLKKTAMHVSQATSKFQFELLRALIVQTIVPICISYSPCLLCWYSPMFGVQLPREVNYFEVSALGIFSFVDPLAIIFCLPPLRKRILHFWKNMKNSANIIAPTLPISNPTNS
ncbi:Serpentine Receptor, class J [Caenorhabditis elegans]|uniref:Serpentine Receptor, class J n=1 Tax=Caenorhabditis elegans TaxID=6239 RepID=O16981_CAEEL|nr:Serpentine Receptor, class J [Caenorhabditis elegans]CCD71812.1 Serpentine Receptor, class J [Caenorhabditis elegans]|eukprot:NP_503767.1 Serpentine Receptor, class J [Caenorhabditis elegans]